MRVIGGGMRRGGVGWDGILALAWLSEALTFTVVFIFSAPQGHEC